MHSINTIHIGRWWALQAGMKVKMWGLMSCHIWFPWKRPRWCWDVGMTWFFSFPRVGSKYIIWFASQNHCWNSPTWNYRKMFVVTTQNDLDFPMFFFGVGQNPHLMILGGISPSIPTGESILCFCLSTCGCSYESWSYGARLGSLWFGQKKDSGRRVGGGPEMEIQDDHSMIQIDLQGKLRSV